MLARAHAHARTHARTHAHAHTRARHARTRARTQVFSVLISIFLNGHALSAQGWLGISLACTGILSELFNDKKGHGAESPAKPKEQGGSSKKHK
jgi:hypothetical protein